MAALKFFFLAFFSGYCFLHAEAQYPKLIIQFNDKSSNTYSLSDPSRFLSQRAIERRIRYNIPIDSTDLPITAKFVDSIRLAGNVRVLSASKWLNQVLIETTDQNVIKKITSLPFVKSAKNI